MITRLILATILFMLVGCADQGQIKFDQALSFYNDYKLEDARPLFEASVAESDDNAEAYAYLAETYRRLGMRDEAVKAAEMSLDVEACNSFALVVLAEVLREPLEAPRSETDSIWLLLHQAVMCDSTDGNAWLSLWSETILRDEPEMQSLAMQNIYETEFLSPAALSFGRWLLRTVPEDGLLITYGDMDTYPLRAVQEAEGFRPDVLVVEIGMLVIEEYRDFLRNEHGLPFEFDDPELDSVIAVNPAAQEIPRLVLRNWMSLVKTNSFGRPLVAAVTVDPAFYSDWSDRAQYCGPYFLLHATPPLNARDTSAIRESIGGADIESFEGPWVSDRDRSPVRIKYTKRLAPNVSEAAVFYAEELIKAERFDDAATALDWAERFENATEMGPVFTERIAELREMVEAHESGL